MPKRGRRHETARASVAAERQDHPVNVTRSVYDPQDVRGLALDTSGVGGPRLGGAAFCPEQSVDRSSGLGLCNRDGPSIGTDAGVTAEAAFPALKRQSQRSNVKLHTIAGKIIGGRLPFIG